jgi:hypothetical protein
MTGGGTTSCRLCLYGVCFALLCFVLFVCYTEELEESSHETWLVLFFCGLMVRDIRIMDIGLLSPFYTILSFCLVCAFALVWSLV